MHAGSTVPAIHTFAGLRHSFQNKWTSLTCEREKNQRSREIYRAKRLLKLIEASVETAMPTESAHFSKSGHTCWHYVDPQQGAKGLHSCQLQISYSPMAFRVRCTHETPFCPPSRIDLVTTKVLLIFSRFENSKVIFGS